MKGNVELDKLIHIEWEGPFTIESIKTLKGPTDHGVYQIYGAHSVYGSGCLLYIGKAEWQTFGDRIAQRNWEFNQDSKRVEIYVGRLSGNETPSDDAWVKDISNVEKLLIYAHAPAGNSSNVRDISKDFPNNIHILNWGCFRDLLPEVSGHRWTLRHHAMERYEPYGQETSVDA